MGRWKPGIINIVGEQRARTREQIFKRITAGVPKRLAVIVDDLLVIDRDKNFLMNHISVAAEPLA